MRLSATVKAICSTYRNIFREDGYVTREELIQMLKVDELIPEKYRTDKGFEVIADYIEKNSGIRELTNERRMNLYLQGLNAQEMAEKEGVDISSINYWLRKRGLNKKEACDNRR